jgi:hypothetical protein
VPTNASIKLHKLRSPWPQKELDRTFYRQSGIQSTAVKLPSFNKARIRPEMSRPNLRHPAERALIDRSLRIVANTRPSASADARPRPGSAAYS